MWSAEGYDGPTAGGSSVQQPGGGLQKTKKKKKRKKGGNTALVLKLLEKSDNQICADCEQKHLKYASVTWGVFLCRECGKSHTKELGGASISKEIGVDTFTKSDVNILSNMGNVKANSLYEAVIAEKPGRKKPFTSERFIKDKYKYKFFWNQQRKDYRPDAVYGLEPGESAPTTATATAAAKVVVKKPVKKVRKKKIKTKPPVEEDLFSAFEASPAPANNSNSNNNNSSQQGDWNPFGESTPAAATAPADDLDSMLGMFASTTVSASTNTQTATKPALDVMSLFDEPASQQNDVFAPNMGMGQSQNRYQQQQQQHNNFQQNSMSGLGFGQPQQQHQQQQQKQQDWTGLGF